MLPDCGKVDSGCCTLPQARALGKRPRRVCLEMAASEKPTASSTISSSRLETFSDGVFAIAATLLILDVHAGPGELGARLLHSWPSYVAYAVSFLTIGIIWINHHTVFTQIRRVDRLFLLINVAFLMVVAFIPFRPASLPPICAGTT